MGKGHQNQARFRDGRLEVQAQLGHNRREDGKVKCLGMIFKSEEERRRYFLKKLREKLKDPQFRKTSGFPLANDEAILKLSDPPYYTACPNPFLRELIEEWQVSRSADQEAEYHREPFAVDVSEGKTDQLYRAHGYITKVPHLAIVPSILHYTRPGDIVLDGFAGSGMTGVAAQWCGNPPEGYMEDLNSKWQEEGLRYPEWGGRRVLLNDLSPLAGFIAANYNLAFDVQVFERTAQGILDEVKDEIGWMYETTHTDGRPGLINYTVWSEVFSCPECASEIVFVNESLDYKTLRTRSEFPCPFCGVVLGKRSLERRFEVLPDSAGSGMVKRIKLRPVRIRYDVDGERFERPPSQGDIATIERINRMPFPSEIPTRRLPVDQMYHGSRIAPKGFTHVHHFFLPRQAHALAGLWKRANSVRDSRLARILLWTFEQAIWGMSVLNRFSPSHYSQVNRALDGVYYVPSQISEVSPWYNLENKIGRLSRHAFRHDFWADSSVAISTGDCASLPIPDQCIDYIFTDPPFGENKYYADLNYFIESWHKVWTNAEPEAIIDRAKNKDLPKYQDLMRQCFEEYHRVLKAGRWMTVVFSNSRNSVWNAIQDAMLAAGFVVADVRTLDKQQGSYRQVTSSAVKQNLVISAYKPSSDLERRFTAAEGTEEGAWQFVRDHLSQVPVVSRRGDQIEAVAERQAHVLFDRMVAFLVKRGATVPLSASDFRAGLAQRFPEREGMYFLPEQVAKHDRERRRVMEVIQLQIVVSDEASAIQWLRRALNDKPQTFQELHPDFIRLIVGWQKYENPIELIDMLRENFVRYDGEGEVPAPVHSYLSSNYHELRNLPKDDPRLRKKGKDRWYLPDPRKASDLERIRERELLKEFGHITQQKGRIKLLRTEAARVGFRQLWELGDYKTIIDVAAKLSPNLVEEDPHLLMYFDSARSRLA